MSQIKLTFPIFYHCAIKGACSLQQYHCVNVLLAGKLKSDDSTSISESTASVYVNGAKPLPKDMIFHLLHLPAEEIVRRLRELNFFDVSAVADAVVRLLDLVDISSSAKAELLRARQGENAEYAFLGEVFRSSLRNPAPTVRLTIEEKATVRLCRNRAETAGDTMGNSPEQEVSPEQTEAQTNTPKETDTQSASFQYEQQRRELLHVYEYTAETPQQLSTLFHLCVEKMVDQPSFINLDYADIAAVLPREPDEYAVFLECRGNSTEIATYIRQSTHFKNAAAVLIYISGPESFGIEAVSELTAPIQDNCPDEANIIFGIRYDDSLADNEFRLYLTITLRGEQEQTESRDSSSQHTDSQRFHSFVSDTPDTPEEPDESDQFPLNLFK